MSIEQYQPNEATTYQTDPTGGRLVAWATAATAAHQLAVALVKTSFVPAAFKGNPGDATAAIIMGDELGLSPLAALRSIYSVHGTPAMYARTMVALAQGQGHEIWTETSTPNRVVVCGRRKGTEHVERAVWTIERAQKAGYTSNKKYASTPEEMLFAKGAAEVARKVAADVLAGIPYSVEDLELEDTAAASVVPVQREPVKRTAKRADPPPTPPEPDLEPVPPEEPEPELTEAGITDGQLKMLHVVLRNADITDRDAGLDVVSSLVGHAVESTKNLTKAEASRVIDRLSEPDMAGDHAAAVAGEES